MDSKLRVLKFGGSSIGDKDRILNVIDIVAKRKDALAPGVIVFSAVGGVTDELIRISKAAARGDESYREALAEIQAKHVELLRQLVPEREQSAPLVKIKMWCNDLHDVLNGVFLVGELSKRCLDYVMSFGELLSCLIVSSGMKAKGIPCEFLDTRSLIKTDTSFGAGQVEYELTNANIRSTVEGQSTLFIATGFIASTANNDVITLGRGGSDFTASIFAAALDASEIEIWTDVDGMMTADPRKVPKAFSQLSISYVEAMELSHFGAKVIYPPTMQPALDKGIPIRIKNTFNPEHNGTIVGISSEHVTRDRPVTGISSIDRVSLLRLQGSGMIGVAGVSKRLFGALAEKAVSVILITQASSEHTICFAVRPDDALLAKQAIEEEFKLELLTRLVDPVVVEEERSIVSVVGENMQRTPGVAARMFAALGKNGVNIIAIAQGSSELNISAVVEQSNETKALNALHEEFFFPDTKTVNVFLAGTGLIGGALLRQIESHSKVLQEELAHEIRVVGLANSSSMVLDQSGLDLNKWEELLSQGTRHEGIDNFVSAIDTLNLPGSVFVDCTASDQVVEQYEALLRSNISIVTPNKKAQTLPIDRYQRLDALSKRRGVAFLYETSVGAGLPVISTLNDLLKSGDTILSIEAVLSGTLSFIFNSFGPGAKFSEVVRRAQEAGYTEPDPRDDLNGLDVARKILILARQLGLELELADVSVENLVPTECRSAASVDEFLAKLGDADPEFEKRRMTAEKQGEKLVYLAALQNGAASVTLHSVNSDHPFYNLSGSDNIISFTTNRYRERPLVVKGPGAGAEVTAAGVFADILRIAG